MKSLKRSKALRRDLWVWEGDPEPDLAIAGHSHRAAYRAAIRQSLLPTGVRAATLEPAGSGPDRAVDFAYWQTASKVDAEALVLVWRGNQHNADFLLAADPPFRLHDSREADGLIVPAAMVSALWEPSVAELDGVVPQAATGRVVVVGTPPPKSEAALRSGLGSKSVFSKQIEAGGYHADTVPLTPGPVRISLWEVLQDDLRRRAESLGSIFVGVPGRVRTQDGYLRPEYSVDDPSHGNAAFGAIMIEEVLRALDAGRNTGGAGGGDG